MTNENVENKAFRRFEDTDWRSWAGAEEFEGGGLPFIMDLPFGQIIADKDGLTLCAEVSEDELWPYVCARRSYADLAVWPAEIEAEVILATLAERGPELTLEILLRDFSFETI
jgi:hypothetical protein